MIYGMSEMEVSGSNPMSSAKARDLLVQIAAGDRTAFEGFAREVTPFVHARVSKIVWDQGAAEDVTQAVMLKVWTGASRFNSGRGNAFAWLTTICRNTAIDHRRVEQRHQRIFSAVKETAEVLDDNVLDETLASEERSEVQQALASLNTTQRDAIQLAYFEGLTYVEVAERLGEPEGTVKARIRRGMIQLSRLLGESHVN